MTLAIGQKAPDFSGVDQNNHTIRLSDYKGKKLILFFYPKDQTPGCTAAACSLRDHYQTLKSHGFELLGVSPDSVASHQKFIDKQNLPMPLLADTEKVVLQAYGVWAQKSMYGRQYMGVVRTTVVIDENGHVEQIFDKVNTKTHGEQILKIYGF